MGKLKELARESLHGKNTRFSYPNKIEKTDAEKLKEANQKTKTKQEVQNTMVVAALGASSTVYT